MAQLPLRSNPANPDASTTAAPPASRSRRRSRPSHTRRNWAIAAMVVLAAVVIAVIASARSHDAVTVQSVRASRRSISAIVTASGEITPKTYADISPNNIGQITNLYVKEGEHVHKGQLLAKLWNVQEASEVQAMQASLVTSQANRKAQAAAVGTAEANLQRDQAQLAQVSADWRRTQALYRDQLVAHSDFQAEEATYKTAVAQVALSQAGLRQARAQLASTDAQIAQARANLRAASDVLSRTEFTSPLDGIVTYLPVHVGDTVVMGIQNSPGSVLMRIADMSVVTADVLVDETDIANVAVGQPASITIDAFGDKTFPATVTEVGDTAILRSTGVAATSTTGAQQAKDFKVVVQLLHPPAGIRPGLSCTAKITTATATQAVAVPLQAVVERDPSQLQAKKKVNPRAVPVDNGKPETPIQGVFLVDAGTHTAVFQKVSTGVAGVDQIQILSGVQPGDEIVTGPYTALRTLANHARIRVDNAVPQAASQ